MHVEVLDTLVAELGDHIFQTLFIVGNCPQAPLFPGVQVPEIDGGKEHLVDLAKAHDLFQRADLRDLAHRFGAEIQILQIVHVDVVAKHFQARLGQRHRRLALHLPLRGAVEHAPLAPHQLQHPAAVQHIIIGILRAFVGGVGKIDIIGRVHADGHILRRERLSDGDRLRLAHPHSPAEGIFKAV